MRAKAIGGVALGLVPAGWLALAFGASWALADPQTPRTATDFNNQATVVYASLGLGILCFAVSVLCSGIAFRQNPRLALLAGSTASASLVLLYVLKSHAL